MSETYQDYEQEFQQHLSRIKSFLSSSSHAKSQTTLQECDRLMVHAKRCANAMRTLMEQNSDSSSSFPMQQVEQRIRELDPWIQELDRARREVGYNKNAFEINHEDDEEEERRQRLFGYQPPQMNTTMDDTQALIADSEALLLDAQGMCIESEQIGSETLMTMGRQRDQLENAAGYMTGATEVLDQARELLQDMHRKAKRNKRVLYGIIVLLIIANISVIIAIIKKKK